MTVPTPVAPAEVQASKPQDKIRYRISRIVAEIFAWAFTLGIIAIGVSAFASSEGISVSFGAQAPHAVTAQHFNRCLHIAPKVHGHRDAITHVAVLQSSASNFVVRCEYASSANRIADKYTIYEK